MQLLTMNDVIEKSYDDKYTGKILVLKPEALSSEYRSAKYQLFQAYGGFGCDPNKLGTAVFGKFLVDGEEARFDRSSFYGVVKLASYDEWMALYSGIDSYSDQHEDESPY